MTANASKRLTAALSTGVLSSASRRGGTTVQIETGSGESRRHSSTEVPIQKMSAAAPSDDLARLISSQCKKCLQNPLPGRASEAVMILGETARITDAGSQSAKHLS